MKGEALWAFVVLGKNVAPSEALRAELTKLVADKLGSSFRPASVRFVTALPKTRSAKVLRRAIRAVALGTLGGMMGGLWNLTSHLHRRDYDPAYTADYWASPVKGALLGGVIFFLSALGVLAAPGALGTATFLGSLHSTHFLMYFLALVSGIAQDYIFEFVRGVLAAIFRSPRALKGDRA